MHTNARYTYPRRSLGPCVRVACVLLVLATTLPIGGSTANGKAAPQDLEAQLQVLAKVDTGLSADQSELDLCALLSAGGPDIDLDPGVGKAGSTEHCKATKKGLYKAGDPFLLVNLWKEGSPTEAYNHVKNIAATDSKFKQAGYGDIGFERHSTYYKDEVAEVLFARSCYFFNAIIDFDPGSGAHYNAGSMQSFAHTVDSQLSAHPCGGSSPAPVVRAIVTDIGTGALVYPVDAPDTRQDAVAGQVLREGDTITAGSTPLKLEWKDGNDSMGATVRVAAYGSLRIGSIKPAQAPDKPSVTFSVLRGFIKFWFQSEPAKKYKFEAATGTVVVAVKGTIVVIGYDADKNVSTVGVEQGSVEVKPTNALLPPFTLSTGKQVEVGASKVGPETAYVDPLPQQPQQPPQATSRTFPETGHTVKGRFLEYWNEHGSLAQQGYPISEEMQEKSDTDGKVYTVQFFERAVFEYHPEFAPPNDVLLSLLGYFFYKQKYPGPGGALYQNNNPPAGAVTFPETGKWVAGGFLDYWRQHGSLAQQGYPISNEFVEVSQADGKPYTVQYFQRAVFEYHPEFKGTQNEILLSLLGTFSYKQKYVDRVTPTPLPGGSAGGGATPAPTSIPATPSSGGGPTNVQLLRNAGCEERLTGDKPAAWTEVEGNQWNCSAGGQSGFAPAHEGQHLFYSGEVPRGELRQDVNVSAYAAGIASGKQWFQFSGWVDTYPQSPPDTAQVIVEYRDAGNSTVLSTYDSGDKSNLEWTRLEDKRLAPAGTGWIRIRLIAKRQSGSANDGIFDDLSLTAVAGEGGGGGTGGTCADIPASQNMTITPSNCAGPGTTFGFVGSGFNPNEQVGVYATGPDGSVLGATFQATAGQNGITSQVNLTTQTNTPPGIYALTMEGVTSHRKAIGYIRVIAP